MKLFVADAKYRGLYLAYDTKPQSHGNPQFADLATDYFNGSPDNSAEALPYTKDDAWIQSTYDALRDDGTAKSNTDILMGFSTTEAAHHCRNQNISGVGQLDLPNLYELIILYLESDNIDALDPTAGSNRDKALGMMNPQGRFHFSIGSVWPSTECDRSKAWAVHYYGYATASAHTGIGGVAPVKELEA